MGIDAIFEKWFAKDGKLSLPVALQVSAFLFFADLCLHKSNFHPFTPWISAAENVPSLLFALFSLIALYSLLSVYLIPFSICILIFFMPSSLFSGSESDYEARKSVNKDQYERYAVETNSAAMLAAVTHQKEESTRQFRNVELFLMWMWLAWAEVSFCLPAFGTLGNRVMPLPVSPWINWIGALICFGITILWVAVAARNLPSSKVPVSQKLRLEILEREKGPTPAVVKNPNQDQATFSPLTFPTEPMIGVTRVKRQSGT